MPHIFDLSENSLVEETDGHFDEGNGNRPKDFASQK